MAEVSAHVVARFPASAGGGRGLTIEADPGIYGDSDVHLLISPPGVATIIGTDIGSVRLGSTKPIPVDGGILQISGSNTANLPRFVGGGTTPMFEVKLAIIDGVQSEVSFTYNQLTNELRLSEAAHAFVKYSDYEIRAQELIYTPEVGMFPGGGALVRYGYVWAFAPPDDLVLYQVTPANLDLGNSEYEIYRITSPVIGNGTGIEYEKPPNYPNSGAYTAPPVAFVLELEGTFQTKRTHEIGLMDSLGRAWVRTFFRANLEPYIGNSNFTPTKTLEPSTLPDDIFDKSLILKAKNIVAARGQGKI